MDDNGEQRNQFGDTIKQGIAMAFNKMPPAAKFKLIGIITAVVVVLLFILIIIASIAGPWIEFKSNLDNFMNGTTDAADYINMDQYNFYKTLSELQKKYGEKIDLPLLMATLFYNKNESEDYKGKDVCADANGNPAPCTSEVGLNYYGKVPELQELVNNMIETTETEDDKEIYNFDVAKYDAYLLNTYIGWHPIRFAVKILISTEAERQQVIDEIHKRAEQNKELNDELIASNLIAGEDCAQVIAAGVNCICVPSAKATFISDPNGDSYGGSFQHIYGACSGLSGSRWDGTTFNLEPEFARRLNNFLDYIHNDLGLYASIGNGWRSFQGQVNCTTSKCASIGTSKHGWGLAADINLGIYINDPKNMERIHQAAPNFGLTFNLCPDYSEHLKTGLETSSYCWQGEYWHIQPQNIDPIRPME